MMSSFWLPFAIGVALQARLNSVTIVPGDDELSALKPQPVAEEKPVIHRAATPLHAPLFEPEPLVTVLGPT